MPDQHLVLSLDDLCPAPWNPKQPIHGQYKTGLETSLDYFGLRDTLKVWEDPENPGKYFVLDGNQRLGVLKASGLESVECRVLEDLDADEAKLFTASFDRNTARYDESKLADLADSLRSKGDELIAKLLRADVAMVKPPLGGDTPEIATAKVETLGSVPLMFTLSRAGYDAARMYILKSKVRLKQEERLLEVLKGFSERQMDDLVVDLAIQIAVDG